MNAIHVRLHTVDSHRQTAHCKISDFLVSFSYFISVKFPCSIFIFYFLSPPPHRDLKRNRGDTFRMIRFSKPKQGGHIQDYDKILSRGNIYIKILYMSPLRDRDLIN